MKLIKAKVIGKKSFTKGENTYNIVNVGFSADDVEGMDVAGIFVDSLKDYKVGDEVKITRAGKYVNIIEE